MDKTKTIELQCVDMYVVDEIIGSNGDVITPFKPEANFKKDFKGKSPAKARKVQQDDGGSGFSSAFDR